MKKILIGLGAIIAVVVGVAIFVFANLGDIIKHGIETVGSDATQAKVTVNDVDLDVTQGTGALKGMVVGNPKGFQTPSAFELGSVTMQIDTTTLDKNPIVIKRIAVVGPVVTYEKAGGGSNIDALKANVDAYAKKLGAGGGKTEEKSEKGEGRKLVIEKLTITGGKVKLSAGLLKGKTLDASLPDLTLTDIGKDKGGASPADIAKSVMDKLTSGIASINPEGMIKDAAAAAAKAIEGASKAAGDAVKGVTEGAGGAADGAGKMIEGAGDKLKGLFGK